MRVYRDGDQWCAVRDDFVNLQESPAGFGEEPQGAIDELLSSIERGLVFMCTCGNNGGGDCWACGELCLLAPETIDEVSLAL